MYNQCPDCGANLDPCERCDCKEKAAAAATVAARPKEVYKCNTSITQMKYIVKSRKAR